MHTGALCSNCVDYKIKLANLKFTGNLVMGHPAPTPPTPSHSPHSGQADFLNVSHVRPLFCLKLSGVSLLDLE